MRGFQNKKGFALRLQKSRMPQVQGVEGEAVVCYAQPLTTQEMRCHRLSRRVNNMAGFSLFVHVTRSEFAKIAQEPRNVILSLLFRTSCHVVYATLGFTLLEVLIAMVILSIGLLSMAGLTTGIMRGNSFSNRMTTATMLAREKMESIRRLGYAGASTIDETTTEDYSDITHYPSYKRITSLDVANPASGMKRLTVTVYWDGDVHWTSLATIMAQ
jgi:type IV pilus assembly protein PilV